MAAEIMSESNGNVIGIKASGKLSDDDYGSVMRPAIEQWLDQHKSVRLLFYMDESFDGFETGAMWEDAKFGASHFVDIVKGKLDRMALVGGSSWERKMGEIFGYLVPGQVKGFTEDELAAAWEWVKS